jgi:DMSO/TMAO reductase YedYZ molybdopterin-dependent catalytic subunit
MSVEKRPVIVSSDVGRERRIPPGQSETKKWPVLHYGEVPRVDLGRWDFRVWGREGVVKNEWRCGWEGFRGLPWVDVRCDIHCVTRWSRLNNVFSGPSTRTVMEKVGITLENGAGKFVLVHGEGGFTTNLSMEEFLDEDCLFAIEHDGKPLEPDHGWPVRLVVPRLYFWKSAKWVRGVEVMSKDEAGFWEQNGYHMHGDPWVEERHSW